MSALSDLAEHVAAEQCFAIEFEAAGVYRYMTVRFWKGHELCRVFICRSSFPATDITGELGSLARFLSAVSTQPDVVACSGCHVDFAKTIDQSDYFPQGVQSCFRFEQLSLPTLMHKSKYSVFGQIDFFSVLQALMVSLGGSLTEEWAMRSPELTKVSTSLHLSFDGRGSFNLGMVRNNSQQQDWF